MNSADNADFQITRMFETAAVIVALTTIIVRIYLGITVVEVVINSRGVLAFLFILCFVGAVYFRQRCIAGGLAIEYNSNRIRIALLLLISLEIFHLFLPLIVQLALLLITGGLLFYTILIEYELSPNESDEQSKDKFHN